MSLVLVCSLGRLIDERTVGGHRSLFVPPSLLPACLCGGAFIVVDGQKRGEGRACLYVCARKQGRGRRQAAGRMRRGAKRREDQQKRRSEKRMMVVGYERNRADPSASPSAPIEPSLSYIDRHIDRSNHPGGWWPVGRAIGFGGAGLGSESIDRS